MSTLDSLLESVKSSILDHVDQGGHKNFDTGGLLGKITDLFGRHSQSSGGGSAQNPRPASEDPYGDPADQGGASARGSAPARGSVPRGANVKPASEDPYGDPADEGKPRR